MDNETAPTYNLYVTQPPTGMDALKTAGLQLAIGLAVPVLLIIGTSVVHAVRQTRKEKKAAALVPVPPITED